MGAVQTSQFLACEYYPPGNVIGQFEYVSSSPSYQNHKLRTLSLPILVKMFKSEAKTFVFYPGYIYPLCRWMNSSCRTSRQARTGRWSFCQPPAFTMLLMEPTEILSLIACVRMSEVGT